MMGIGLMSGWSPVIERGRGTWRYDRKRVAFRLWPRMSRTKPIGHRAYPEERLLLQVLLALDLLIDLLGHIRDQHIQQPAEEEHHVL